MGRNTRVQPADHLVEHFLFFTHVVVVVTATKTVFFVNHIPNSRAVIVRERLNILIEVEIFTLIILLVFYMPLPVYYGIPSAFLCWVNLKTWRWSGGIVLTAFISWLITICSLFISTTSLDLPNVNPTALHLPNTVSSLFPNNPTCRYVLLITSTNSTTRRFTYKVPRI
jgi:hypothetical protein